MLLHVLSYCARITKDTSYCLHTWKTIQFLLTFKHCMWIKKRWDQDFSKHLRTFTFALILTFIDLYTSYLEFPWNYTLSSYILFVLWYNKKKIRYVEIFQNFRISFNLSMMYNILTILICKYIFAKDIMLTFNLKKKSKRKTSLLINKYKIGKHFYFMYIVK